MTHPTPEQERAAEERLQTLLSWFNPEEYVHPSHDARYADFALLLSVVERQREALRIAIQLADIASDWNLDEVRIDGEMRPIHDVKNIFRGRPWREQ